MLKALIQLPYSVTGNVKIQNFVQFIKSDATSFTGIVKNARLTPLYSSGRYSNIECNLLTSDYSLDIRKFYHTSRDTFFNLPENPLTVLDDTSAAPKSNFCTDFSWGCKRISYRKNYNCTHTFLAPIWSDGEFPDEFKITIRPKSGNQRVITITIPLKESSVTVSGKNYLNHLPEYLKRYCSQLDEKVVRLDYTNKYAYIFGISVKNGGFCQVKNTAISTIWEHQMPINAFDFNICKMYQLSEVVIKQVLPLSFSFDLNEVLTNFNINQYQITGEYIYNQQLVPFVSFQTDYTYRETLFPCLDIKKSDSDTEKNVSFNPVYKKFNIFSNTQEQDFFLNEGQAEIYRYHLQKYLPYYFQWQLQGSLESNPYIVNLSEAYNQYLWNLFDGNNELTANNILKSNIFGKYANIPFLPINKIYLNRYSYDPKTNSDSNIELLSLVNPIKKDTSFITFNNQKYYDKENETAGLSLSYNTANGIKYIKNDDWLLHNIFFYNQWFDNPYIFSKEIQSSSEYFENDSLEDNLIFKNGTLDTLVIGPGLKLYNNQCLYKGVLYDFSGEELDEVRIESKIIYKIGNNKNSKLDGPVMFMSFNPYTSDDINSSENITKASTGYKWNLLEYQNIFGTHWLNATDQSTEDESNLILYSYTNKYLLPFNQNIYNNINSQDISIPKIQGIGIPVDYPILFNIQDKNVSEEPAIQVDHYTKNPCYLTPANDETENEALTRGLNEVFSDLVLNILKWRYATLINKNFALTLSVQEFNFLIPYNNELMNSISYIEYLAQFGKLNNAFIEQYDYSNKANITSTLCGSDENILLTDKFSKLENYINQNSFIKYSYSQQATKISQEDLINNIVKELKHKIYIPLILNCDKIRINIPVTSTEGNTAYKTVTNIPVYWRINFDDSSFESRYNYWNNKFRRALVYYALYLLKSKNTSGLKTQSLENIKKLIITTFGSMPVFKKKYFKIFTNGTKLTAKYINSFSDLRDSKDSEDQINYYTYVTVNSLSDKETTYTLLDAVQYLYNKWSKISNEIIYSNARELNLFLNDSSLDYEETFEDLTFKWKFEKISTDVNSSDNRVRCTLEEVKSGEYIIDLTDIKNDIGIGENKEIVSIFKPSFANLSGSQMQIPSFKIPIQKLISGSLNKFFFKKIYHYLFLHNQFENMVSVAEAASWGVNMLDEEIWDKHIYLEPETLIRYIDLQEYDIEAGKKFLNADHSEFRYLNSNCQGVLDTGIPVFEVKRNKSKIYTTSENMETFKESIISTYLTDRRERFQEYIYNTSNIKLTRKPEGIPQESIEIDYRINYSPKKEEDPERYFFITDEKYLVDTYAPNGFNDAYKKYFFQDSSDCFHFNNSDVEEIIREYRSITKQLNLPNTTLESSASSNDEPKNYHDKLIWFYKNIENPKGELYHNQTINIVSIPNDKKVIVSIFIHTNGNSSCKISVVDKSEHINIININEKVDILQDDIDSKSASLVSKTSSYKEFAFEITAPLNFIFEYSGKRYGALNAGVDYNVTGGNIDIECSVINNDKQYIFNTILTDISKLTTDEGTYNSALLKKYKDILSSYTNIYNDFFLNYTKESEHIQKYYDTLNTTCQELRILYKRSNKQSELSTLSELMNRVVLWKLVKEKLNRYFFEYVTFNILYKDSGPEGPYSKTYKEKIKLQRYYRFAKINSEHDLENVIKRKNAGYLYITGKSLYLPSETAKTDFSDNIVFGLKLTSVKKENGSSRWSLVWNDYGLVNRKKKITFVPLNLEDIKNYGYLTFHVDKDLISNDLDLNASDVGIDCDPAYSVWKKMLHNMFVYEGPRGSEPGTIKVTKYGETITADLQSFYKYNKKHLKTDEIMIPLWYLEEFVSFENLDIYYSLIEREKAYSLMWVEANTFDWTFAPVFKGNENEFTYEPIKHLEYSEGDTLESVESELIKNNDKVKRFVFDKDRSYSAVIFLTNSSLFLTSKVITDFSQIPYINLQNNQYPYVIQDISTSKVKDQIIKKYLENPQTAAPIYMVATIPSINYGLYKKGRRGLLRYNIFVSPDEESFFYKETGNMLTSVSSDTLIKALVDQPSTMRQMVNVVRCDILPVIFNTQWSVKPTLVRLRQEMVSKTIYDYSAGDTGYKSIEYIDSQNTRDFLRYFHFISPAFQEIQSSTVIPLYGKYRVHNQQNFDYEYIFRSTQQFYSSSHVEQYWDTLTMNTSYSVTPTIVSRPLYEDKWFNDSLCINLPHSIKIRHSKLLKYSELSNEEEIAKKELQRYFINMVTFVSSSDFIDYLFFNYDVKYTKDLEKYIDSEPYYSLTLEFNLY